MDKTRGKDLIPVAKDWLDHGITPIPLYYKSKKSTVLWREWEPDERDVVNAFDTELYRNIGVLLSGGLTILDFDVAVDYVRWKRNNNIETFTVLTSRGFHVYLYLNSPPSRTTKFDGGDIKVSGYVVVPPSVHKSGSQYRVHRQNSILRAENLQAVGITPIVPITSILGHSVASPEILENIKTGKNRGSIVQQIKAALPIEDLLCQYTKLEPSSGTGWYMCCCPFHDDHTPSMWVNTALGLCSCYKPGCVAHGDRPLDVINVYGLLTGSRNGEAVMGLASKLFVG